MAVELRTGRFGEYYGTPMNKTSEGIYNSDQLEKNIEYIYKYFSDKGWTINAISGMLGNMKVESSVNPGRWQNDDFGNWYGGYGLVQWTPAKNYFDWCTAAGKLDYSEMDSNLDRIIYELENGLQWIPTDEYNMTFEQFTKSTDTPETLAVVFLKNYERAGVEVVDERKVVARGMFNYLMEYSGGGSVIYINTRKRFNFVLFGRRRIWNATRRF